MPEAILFDFDGVIVDSEPLHYQAFLAAAHRFNAPFDYETYIREYIGYDDRDFWRVYLRDRANRPEAARDEGLIAMLCVEKGVAFEAIVSRGVKAMPGAVELIRSAREADLPIAIASGATQADIDLILGGLGLTDCFQVIVTADDVAHSKPDPMTYQLAWERLSAAHPGRLTQPARALAIEDTVAGISSARGAGVATLAVLTTTPREQLTAAHRIVDSLAGVTLETLAAWFD